MENTEKALFRNAFVPTRSHYIQAFRSQIFGGSRARFFGLLALTFALLALVILTNLFLGQAPVESADAILVAAIGILIVLECLLFFWMPVLQASMLLRRQRESHQDNGTLETVFYEETVQRGNSKAGKASFIYEAFSHCSETDDLLLLRTKGKQLLFLAKAGFDSESEADFKAFIQRKCPKARIRWRRG